MKHAVTGAETEPLDRLSNLFGGDVLLRSQFNDLRRSVAVRPLQRLFVAVLGDAVDCFFDYAEAHPLTPRGRLHAEAARWLFAETAASAFSLVWICDGLGIDPDYLRAGIRRIAGQPDRLS